MFVAAGPLGQNSEWADGAAEDEWEDAALFSVRQACESAAPIMQRLTASFVFLSQHLNSVMKVINTD